MPMAFRFQKFTIHKNQYSHKIGTDAMVLGSLVRGKNVAHVLDVGAGSGVLGLMMAQNFENSLITCLEIDPSSYEECVFNVNSSVFHDRIKTDNLDILQYQSPVRYDIIVCNPPYYLSNNPSNVENQLQKHITLSVLQSWFEKWQTLLSDEGQLWLIFPFHSKDEFIGLAQKAGLTSVSQTHILNQYLEPIRIVQCWSKQPFTEVISTLTLRNLDGTYSEEYKELTKNFHDRVPKR